MLTSYQCICMFTPSFISKIMRRMRKMTNLFDDFCPAVVWNITTDHSYGMWASLKNKIQSRHYCDVIMSAMAPQKHRRLNCLLNRFFRRRSKKTSKLHITGFLWGESTGHRWIPLRKCQLRGKCFHLMTSSWLPNRSPLLAHWIVVPTTPVVPATWQLSSSRDQEAFYNHID